MLIVYSEFNKENLRFDVIFRACKRCSGVKQREERGGNEETKKRPMISKRKTRNKRMKNTSGNWNNRKADNAPSMNLVADWRENMREASKKTAE